MGWKRCCVENCPNKSTNKGVSFYTFPYERSLRSQWIKSIGDRYLHHYRKKLGEKYWEPRRDDKVCGVHFHPSGRRKKKKQIPKLFPESVVPDSNVLANNTFDNDITNHSYDLNPEVVVEHVIEVASTDLKEASASAVYSIAIAQRSDTTNTYQDGLILPYNINEGSEETNEVFETREEEPRHMLNLQVPDESQLDGNLQGIAENYKMLTFSLQEECPSVNTMDEKTLRFYTGFRTRDLYQEFSDIMRDSFQQGRELVNCDNLTYDQQLLVVLMKLKLGLLNGVMAYKFKTAPKIIGDIWKSWIILLHSQLSRNHIWPSKDLVQRQMPLNFRENYPAVRVVLIWVEIFMEKPSICIESDTISHYKHHSSAKGLLGVTPGGFIAFVSRLYGSKLSDDEILKRCGIMDLLESGDGVMMTERDFFIEEILAKKEVRAFPTSKIENVAKKVIRGTKQFHILRSVFPSSMQDRLNDVWRVCNYLYNFLEVH